MLAERYILFAAISFRVVRSLNVQALPFPSRSFYPVLKRDRIAKEPFISGAKMTTVLSAVKINQPICSHLCLNTELVHLRKNVGFVFIFRKLF